MLNKLQWRTCLFISLVLLLAACSGQRVMMPTPNVEVNSQKDVYADLHPDLKSIEVPLFYITDRKPERGETVSLNTVMDVHRPWPSAKRWWTWVRTSAGKIWSRPVAPNSD
jgi:hypothetical protein